MVVKEGSATAPPPLRAQQPRKLCHRLYFWQRGETLGQCMELPSGRGWGVRRMKRSGSGAPLTTFGV